MTQIGFDDERVRDAWFREELERMLIQIAQLPSAGTAIVGMAYDLADMMTRIAQDIEDALGDVA